MKSSKNESVNLPNLKSCIGIVSLLAALLCSTSGIAEETLVLVTAGRPPLASADGTAYFDRVAAEAFKRIGKKVKISPLPAERALLLANAGTADGDLSRIPGLRKFYPNLRAVPVNTLSQNFVAFTRNMEIVLTGWQSLKPYNVGILTGWKILENNITETRSLSKVGSPTQLFMLLKNERVDVVVYEKWQGLQLLKELGLTDVKILEPPLANRKTYMYLNKKHEQLIPQLIIALSEMKKDGSLQRIYDQTLRPLLAGTD